VIAKKRYGQRAKDILIRLEPAEAQIWRIKLEKLQADCGCGVGAVLMIAGFSTWVLYTAMEHAERTLGANILLGLGVLIASAAIGKAIGLFIARLRLELMLRKLEQKIISGAASHS